MGCLQTEAHGLQVSGVKFEEEEKRSGLVHVLTWLSVKLTCPLASSCTSSGHEYVAKTIILPALQWQLCPHFINRFLPVSHKDSFGLLEVSSHKWLFFFSKYSITNASTLPIKKHNANKHVNVSYMNTEKPETDHDVFTVQSKTLTITLS